QRLVGGLWNRRGVPLVPEIERDEQRRRQDVADETYDERGRADGEAIPVKEGRDQLNGAEKGRRPDEDTDVFPGPRETPQTTEKGHRKRLRRCRSRRAAPPSSPARSATRNSSWFRSATG